MRFVAFAVLGAVLIGASGACSSAPNPAQTSTAVVHTLETALSQTPVIRTTPGAQGSPVVVAGKDGSGKAILIDTSGHALYELKDDVAASGVTHCYSDCASTWPPLTIPFGFTPQTPGISGKFGSFLRTDGARQVMYNGHPLYRYAKDAKLGDTKGNGVDGRWSVAVP